MPREGFKQDARRVLKARQTHEIRKKRGRKKKVGRKRGKPKKKKVEARKRKNGLQNPLTSTKWRSQWTYESGKKKKRIWRDFQKKKKNKNVKKKKKKREKRKEKKVLVTDVLQERRTSGVLV